MNSRTTRLRTTCLAATAAAVVALVAAPAAQAASDGGSPHGPAFSAAQLNKASEQVTPRSDGMPGRVAQAQGKSSSTSAQSLGGAPKSKSSGSSKNDADVSGFVSKGSVETARGTAETLALNGTKDWVALTTSGSIARYNADGTAKWRVGVHDLEAGWQIASTRSSETEDLVPVMYEGFDPYQPSSTGTHPYAQIDANHDGTADVAVAYQLGVKPDAPFTTPGSDLTSGTFISVLDGKTGAMLWHTIVPGTVGSMVAQDGQLIAAETTGPNWDTNPVATQGNSRSSLLSYSFSGSGAALVGKKAWTYSTGAPNADWTDISSLGTGRIAVGWTDTPMALGDPRPADGHVMVLDTAKGKVVVDTKTPGYPRIVQPDASGSGVLVAEENDPMSAVWWQATDINATTGARTVLATRNGAIPTSLIANPGAHKGQPAYVASELGINADLTDGASSVFGMDKSFHQMWSYRTASAVGAAETPVAGVSYDSRGTGQVLVSTSDPVAETLKSAEGPYHSQLIALQGTTGAVAWQQDSASGDQITAYDGRYLTVGYDLTAYLSNTKGKRTQIPLLGDLYAAGNYDVNGDGTQDVITGGMSHGVFALDGKALAKDQVKVLWKAPVSSMVHSVTVAPVRNNKGKTTTRVVVGTSNGFAVMDATTGAVVSDNQTGAFGYNVKVTDGRILAASGQSFGAYTDAGKALWTFRPAGAGTAQVDYSTPSVSADGIFLEYGGVRSALGTGPSNPVPTGISLDPATGKQLWSFTTPDVQPADPNATPAQGPAYKSAWIEVQAGVLASSAIPNTNGHGVAFAFGGDAAASLGHSLVIVNGKSGKVVSVNTTLGVNSFQWLTADAKQGLLWMHTNMWDSFPADGSSVVKTPTMANSWQGQYVATQQGTQEFVGASGGIVGYPLPIKVGTDKYAHATDSAFAYFAGAMTTLSLHPGTATSIVGLQYDYMAYNLNQQMAPSYADSFASDAFPHGLTVVQATGTANAAGSGATAPAPVAGSVGTTAPSAITQNYMPVGVGTAPHEIKSKVATPAGFGPPAGIRGYTPQQIQKRLGLTGDGAGQTVAISIAYDYPNAQGDVNAYSAQFNLPQTCDSAGADASNCFDLQVKYADGYQPAQNDGWNEEAALDIETIHGLVPKAKILLVEAKDASAASLNQAIDVASTYNPDVINNSWGMPEFSEESFYDNHCKLTNSVCTQSTGDDGWPSGYSSTSPYTLAVGGTSMVLDTDGNTTSETAWTSGGGGFSFFEKQPTYQKGVVDSKLRATPDVSFNADPNTGVAVYVSIQGGHYWMEVGGTSLSSPSWAAILTAADQLRHTDGKAKFATAGKKGDTLHPAVYSLGSALRDVTSGENGACGAECSASSGYDTVTGLGSPLAGIDKALATK